MKKVLFFVGMIISSPVFAQTLSQSDLERLGEVQDQQDYLRNQQVQQQQAEIRKAQQAEENRRNIIARSIAEKNHEQVLENREDRSYLNQNRDIDIQERKAKLQVEQTTANHSEDFVNKAIENQDAQNDLIRSEAEKNRASGTATVNSSKHWWQ